MAVGIPGATPFGGHAGEVICVASSPDGRTLATGGGDGVARLWDTVNARQTAQLTGHTGTVYALAFSPDGTTLATGGRDATIRLWNTATGQEITQLTAYDEQVLALAFSPDGSTLATGGDRTALLWDTATWQQTAQLTGHTNWVTTVAFSPDGTTLATGGTDATTRLWDTATGHQTVCLTGHADWVMSVAFSPDGATLATVGSDAVVRLWNTGTGQQTIQLTGHTGRVNDVAYSPDGGTLATVGFDATIRLWDTATSQQTIQLTGHTGPAFAVAYSPDGSTLATAGSDAIRLWDAATGQQTIQLTGHTGPAWAVAYSPDGSTLATAGNDHTVRLWNTGTGQQITQLTGHTERVNAVAYSPDGSTLATGAHDHTVRLWNTGTRQQITQLTAHTAPVTAVAYSPDGSTLATGGGDHTVRLWNADTWQQITQLTGQNRLLALAFHPYSTTLAGGGHRAARLWDTGTGQQTAQLTVDTDWVRAVAFSPDGATLAAAEDDGTVRLWNSATGQQWLRLTGHTDSAFAVAYSPDGRTVASVGADATIRIWNPRNGTQVNGTGFGAPRAPARPLAGVHSDSPSAKDLLGVGSDVETLAELIAATETLPPLAIALIGDWGAGKSSVMLQIEEQIGVLADRARNNPGLSEFAENVRQVWFNAWHYSDEHLWAGLVSHLFQVLAAPPDAEPDATASDQRAVAAERERLRADLAAKQAASDALAGELKAANAMPQPTGTLGWLGSPWFALRVSLAAAQQGFRDGRASLATVVAWIVLGGGAYAAWYFLGNWIAAVTTVIAVAAPPVTLAVRRLRAGHDAVLAWADKQRAYLADRQQKYQQQVRSIQDQLLLVDAAARLARFLGERGDGAAYQQYQGLVGQVHDDLEQLSADLAQAHYEWEASGGFGAPPLERIVLYIDDLDRCPPQRVVEVLEAVHLMLALDLFVVVVAVDARWLIRSLEYHHHELFGGGEGLATPIDYLDKIFQIPYVLLPPAADATAAYLRALLPEPVAAPPRLALPKTGASDPWTRAAAEEGAVPDDAGDGDSVVGSVPVTEMLEEFPEPRERDPRVRGQLQPIVWVDENVAVDLRPQGLQLSQAEVEFMGRLGGLVPTPRAAKRLVNIYRLVRIGIPDDELAGFVGDGKGGPYQAVQVLLAMLVGHPDFTRKVFLALLDETNGGDLVTLVEKVGGAGGETRTFGMIKNELTTIRDAAAPAVDVGECRRWCPQLARFSFYTRDLAGASPR